MFLTHLRQMEIYLTKHGSRSLLQDLIRMTLLCLSLIDGEKLFGNHMITTKHGMEDMELVRITKCVRMELILGELNSRPVSMMNEKSSQVTLA